MYIYFRKKLRSEIQKSFPSLSDGDAAEIIPSKDEVTTVKIYASAGDNVYIYCVNKQPLLFEFDKEKVLYPTGKKYGRLFTIGPPLKPADYKPTILLIPMSVNFS